MPIRKPTARTRSKASAKPAARTSAPKTVDDYIAAAPKGQRASLTKLRKTIKAAAPKATELVSYGMAGFKQGADRVAYFAYWKEHVALYGTSRDFLDAHADDVEPYVQSKGTLQFPADKPLPYRLVTRIVKARVGEIEKGG
jgi:uncharacterized protein YdhG (YjbR/CyaY superfamily)